MATTKPSKPTDGPPFDCEHCGRTFDSRGSRGAHYRWCEKRPGYKPPAKKKRSYTQTPATRRQRRTAALKHGERSERPFAASACTDDSCRHDNGRPCELRQGLTEQGADNSICWPDALGLDPDRRIRLKQLQATFEQGLDDPIVLDPLKARFFAVQAEAFLDAAETALTDGLTQRSAVLLYEKPDGEQVVGERLSQHPAARLAFGTLAKNLGATAEDERTTRKAHGGALGKQAEDGFDLAAESRRNLMDERQ